MREIEPTEIADHTNIKELEAGSIIKAPPGFSVDFSTPPSVEGYSDYIRQANLTIATALSIPYSLLASDWSESNYSSLKACYLSWFRYVEQKQNIFVTQFCNKLFKWYLESCELTGFDIKGVKAIWALPKKDILDLQKELNAYETGLKNNIFSLKQILRERGNDPDEFLTEIADTQKQLQELGIKQQEEEEE
jgi:capsid protein